MRQKHAWLVHIVLVFFSFLFAFPLLWMISTSLKPISETMSDNIQWIPGLYVYFHKAGLHKAASGFAAPVTIRSIPGNFQWRNYYDAIAYEHNVLGYYPF